MVELIILAVLCFLCWRGGRRKQEQEDQAVFQKYEEEIRDNRQYIRELHAELRQKSTAPTEAAPTDVEPQEPEHPIPVPPTPAPEPIVPKPVTTIRKSILQYGCLFACCTVILVAFAVYMSHDKDKPAERAPAPETTKETFNTDKYRETEKETQKQTTNFEEPEKYGAGHYKVGMDIPAGTYIIFEDGILGSFEYSEDAEGKENSEFSFLSGHAIIEVKKGEYLEISRAYAIPYNEYYKFDVVDGYLGEGDYIIGDQIPAGEYRIEVVDDSALPSYWIYDNVRRDKTVDWQYIENNHYINVKDGELLDLSGCKIYISK